MKKMNKKYKATSLVEKLKCNGNQSLIGCIVKFENLKHKGNYHKNNLFEIIGFQRVYGHNAEGEYTLIDGLRLMSITCFDDFGTPCNYNEISFLTTNN
jgi:hypothetical protein